eukprot:11340069-Alexandrium_andersonii.AAC.1
MVWMCRRLRAAHEVYWTPMHPPRASAFVPSSFGRPLRDNSLAGFRAISEALLFRADFRGSFVG